MKPKIAITSRLESFDHVNKYFVNEVYVDALQRHGAFCCILPTLSEEDLPYIVEQYDGLLVTGGDDFDPKYFNEPLHPTASLTDPRIDKTDILLIKAFYQANKPILGICRGLQAVNVALGGSLYQDIPSQCPNALKEGHNQKKYNPSLKSNEFGHTVLFEKDTVLHSIFNDEYGVNTYHHQAIHKLADPLIISGKCKDGIIEAVEIDNHILAVQWHPEHFKQDEKHNQIFQTFLKWCKATK